MRNVIPYYYLSRDPLIQIKIRSIQRLRFVIEDIFWVLLVFNIVPQFFLNLTVEFFYVNFFIIFGSASVICSVQWYFYHILERIRRDNQASSYDVIVSQLSSHYKKYYSNIRTTLIYKIITLLTVISMVGLGNLIMLNQSNVGYTVRVVVMVVSLLLVVFIVAVFEIFQFFRERNFGYNIASYVSAIKQNILETGNNLLIEDGDMLTTIVLSKEYLQYVYPTQRCIDKSIRMSTIKNFVVFCLFCIYILIGIVSFFARHSTDFWSEIRLICVVASCVFVAGYVVLDFVHIGLSNMYGREQYKDMLADRDKYALNIELYRDVSNINASTTMFRVLSVLVKLGMMLVGFAIGLVCVFVLGAYAFLIVLITLIGHFLYVCVIIPLVSIQLHKNRLTIIVQARQLRVKLEQASTSNSNCQLQQ